MTCIQCNTISKYKCPTCYEPYCSVVCYKEHKQKPCTKPLEQHKEEHSQQKLCTDYDYPTDDTVPPEMLKVLEQSSEIKMCLDNPHVRNMLELLDNSPYPDVLMQEYMQEPIFTEFVDACLRAVQPAENGNKKL